MSFIELLSNVRVKKPVVHFITNYVTVNDCANVALALGGSPIMADEVGEVEQIASQSSALVINIGTVNERTLNSMIRAGHHANQLGIPVVLDPVGADASVYRGDAVKLLLREVDFSIIKGNISEISFLSDGIVSSHGVDASMDRLASEDKINEIFLFSQRLSLMTGSVIAITGPIDIVADSHSGYAIRNGLPMMQQVTGTGCMCAAAAGCFAGGNHDCLLNAAAAAIAAVGLCGELAYEKLQNLQAGLGVYHELIIDAAGDLNDDLFGNRIKMTRIC